MKYNGIYFFAQNLAITATAIGLCWLGSLFLWAVWWGC